MQIVVILSDHELYHALLHQFRDDLVRHCGHHVFHIDSRVRFTPFGFARPQAVRSAEIGQPSTGRNPGPGEHHHVLGLLNESARSGHKGGYRPVPFVVDLLRVLQKVIEAIVLDVRITRMTPDSQCGT